MYIVVVVADVVDVYCTGKLRLAGRNTRISSTFVFFVISAWIRIYIAGLFVFLYTARRYVRGWTRAGGSQSDSQYSC